MNDSTSTPAVPPPVDWYAIQRPSGEKAALPAFVAEAENAVAFLSASERIQMDDVVPVRTV